MILLLVGLILLAAGYFGIAAPVFAIVGLLMLVFGLYIIRQQQAAKREGHRPKYFGVTGKQFVLATFLLVIVAGIITVVIVLLTDDQTVAKFAYDWLSIPTGGSVQESRPSGAMAKCQDGTYSFSSNRSGTCSHHGGVATWLK
jgi:membrane-bound ClpP family serine protease